MIGQQLGPYSIEAEVGSGGMGTVYLATGPAGRIALKIVHPHLLATPGFFKRFLREGEIGQRVEHPHVVGTLDCDQLVVEGTPLAFLVMEYVEGRSLRDLLLDLGTVPETLLREIALQTAAGLEAIHAAGIVHRDLKPENILITEEHEIRIMDLGVAKLQEASIALTREGQFAGSLLYAAPEQFGKEGVGPAADLYSLGVLLLELAIGQNPFRSDDVASVIQAHLTETPPRAEERNESVSPFLSEVIATLLAKEPTARFESAIALQEVLRRAEESEWWANHEPVEDLELPRIRVRRETALHGRAEDLAALEEAWTAARSGAGTVVWIEGEAGSGKTRLVDAFVRGIEDAHVLYGFYPPGGGPGGFSEAVLGKFGAVRLAGALTPYLTVTPALVPAFAALVRHEPPPPGVEPLEGDALQTVAVQLMRALAVERPTVWIVDDLHFAPEESRRLVLAMARAVEEHRVLLVATSRPGVALEEFSRLENYRHRTLARLGAREVMDLLEEAFRSEDLAEKLGGKIAKKSDGVPFFVFEMIRGLKEGQFIQQLPDGTYVQTQVIEEIEVPSAVQDLVEARMRGLTRDERAILDVGAVVGMRFDPGLVARVLEEKRVRVLRDLAEIERRHGLVRDDGRSVCFDQNQIQEVLYRAVPPHLRAEYHTLIAEAYGGDDPVFHAHHHVRGCRPHEAREHLQPALSALGKTSRTEALLDLADRALKIESLLTGTERVETLIWQGGRLGQQGRRDDERAALEEAVAVADETGDPGARSKARQWLGALLRKRGESEPAVSLVRESVELARAAGNPRREARAVNELGNALHQLGRHADARAQHERARELARDCGDREAESSALTSLGNAHASLGHHEEARTFYEESRTLWRELGNRRNEAIAEANLGAEAARLGRYAEAQENFERAHAIARVVGDRQTESMTTLNLGLLALERGMLADGKSRCERARALTREIGHRGNEAIVTGNLGELFAVLGRFADAREQQERFLALSREIGYRIGEAYALCLLADLAEAEGDLDEAVALLGDALTLHRELGHKDGVAGVLVALARLETARGDPERAATHLEQLPETLTTPDTMVAAAIERARLPSGDVGAAVTALADAGDNMRHRTRMEACYRLWQLTEDSTHLEEAKHLLDFLVAHAPEEGRATMLANVPLHREIAEAVPGTR